jgi:hypothetical protein
MKKSVSFFVAVIAALNAASALAAEDFSATVALKAWNNSMSKYLPSTTGSDADLTPIIGAAESSKTTAWIPSVSLRYRDFMVGGSLFAKRSYDFGGDKIDRKEHDLVAGYYVLPTLAIIAGYKEVKQNFDILGPQEWKYTGPIIGFSASAPLTRGFSLYGTAAVGSLKFKPKGSLTDWGSLFPGGLGGYVLNANADYKLGEVGIAYAFEAGKTAGLNAIIATLGYRSQTILVKQKGFAAASNNPSNHFLSWEGLTGRDSTEGITLSIIGAF